MEMLKEPKAWGITPSLNIRKSFSPERFRKNMPLNWNEAEGG